MGATRRILTLAASLAAVSSVASGYAHWIFFNSRNAPFNAIPAMFNLGSLNNNTVSYFISDQTPGPLMPGDSVSNIVSQIQGAAAVWNTVSTSTIRTAFGGFSSVGNTPQSTPGIDVIFDDEVPAGLLAQTRLTFPNSPNALNPANGGVFVPILRSTVILRRDLTSQFQLASYDDLFFMVVVHEFGHALGLQHTLTSGVMSTQTTSATTKAAPLSPDDIAGISLLYPTQNYQQGTGAVSGTVLASGKAVNMANVVALSANGTAISTLSNPDGTYQIQGIPPGQYYVYAGPLPPAQNGESYPDNIVPPQDSQGNPFNANTNFDTEFYPNTRSLSQAGVINVSVGQTAPFVNFNLQTRPGGPAISYMQTIVYSGQVPVYSPPLVAGSRQYLLFGGPGIAASSGSALAAGMSASVLGPATFEPASASYYSQGYGKVIVDAGQVQTATPVTMVVTLPNDMYVLPFAFSVVPNAPPSISNVSGTTDPLGNTILNITGSNLSTASLVFDGVPAQGVAVNGDGSLSVTAPPAASGYTTYIEALSTDGQTSWQDLGTAMPPSYTYSVPQNPSISVNYAQLLPGSTSMLDIIGLNSSFVDGQVSIGLGSSDLTVGRVWVLNSQRILANVKVSPLAQAGPVDLTITSGLQTVTQRGVLQVQTANPNQATLLTPILNSATGLAGTPAGGSATIPTVGVPLNVAGWTLKIDGFTANFQMGGGGLITAQIPQGLPAGVAAAIVQLTSPDSTVTIPAVVMNIDAPDPQILAVANSTGALVTQSNPAHIGDTLTLSVSGLTQSATAAGLSRTQITVGSAGTLTGVAVTPITISNGPVPDTYQIQFTLGTNVSYGPQDWVTVGVGTRISAQFGVSILPQQQQSQQPSQQ